MSVLQRLAIRAVGRTAAGLGGTGSADAPGGPSAEARPTLAPSPEFLPIVAPSSGTANPQPEGAAARQIPDPARPPAAAGQDDLAAAGGPGTVGERAGSGTARAAVPGATADRLLPRPMSGDAALPDRPRPTISRTPPMPRTARPHRRCQAPLAPWRPCPFARV